MNSTTLYAGIYFFDKDSMLQYEEIKGDSKLRVDVARECIGKLMQKDFALFEGKYKLSCMIERCGFWGFYNLYGSFLMLKNGI